MSSDFPKCAYTNALGQQQWIKFPLKFVPLTTALGIISILIPAKWVAK
jgi:hypothetical protein